MGQLAEASPAACWWHPTRSQDLLHTCVGPSPPSPLPLLFYPFLAWAQPWASLPAERVLCFSSGPFTCSAHQGLPSGGAASPTAGTWLPCSHPPGAGGRRCCLRIPGKVGAGKETLSLSILALT